MAERWEKTVWIPSLDGNLQQKWQRRLDGLGVDQAAIADGARNFPEADSQTLSPKEQEIVGIYAEGRDSLADWLRERISEAIERIRAQTTLRFDAQSWVATCKGEVNAALAARRDEIYQACRTEDEAHLSMNEFKAKHDLRRAFQGPSPAKITLGVGILIFCVSIEMALNMSFFSKGVGLLEGALTALAVSISNIGLGVLAGFAGMRLLSNRFLIRKATGLVILLSTLVGAVIANLFYAHAREVAQASEDGGFQVSAAVAHMLSDPINIWGSWGLFALGMIMYVVALLDSRASFTDPYWGYGRFANAFRAAERRKSELLASLRTGVNTQLGRVPSSLDTIEIQARTAHEAAASALKQAEDRHDEIVDSCKLLERLCRQSLQSYQAKNAEVRLARAPAYFFSEEKPELPNIDLDLSPLAALQQDLEGAHLDTASEVAKARQEIASYRETQIETQITKIIDEIRKQASEDVKADEAEIEKLRRRNVRD